jgi:hypothetical protein
MAATFPCGQVMAALVRGVRRGGGWQPAATSLISSEGGRNRGGPGGPRGPVGPGKQARSMKKKRKRNKKRTGPLGTSEPNSRI